MLTILNPPPILAVSYDFPPGVDVEIHCYECGRKWPVSIVEGTLPPVATWSELCDCLRRYFNAVKVNSAE